MEDIESLLSWSAEEIRDKLFTPGGDQRPPLKEIRINRCPFVATIEVLNEENLDRLEIDLKLVKERARKLRQPGVAAKIAQVYQQTKFAPASDVDAALYDGFLQDEDRSRSHFFHQERKAGRWLGIDFKDKRLATLCERLKARGFADTLEPDEALRWHEFVSGKLAAADDAGDWMNLTKFSAQITQIEQDGSLSEQDRTVLRALMDHANHLERKYAL
jgi:exodeoxyribonuclease-1